MVHMAPVPASVSAEDTVALFVDIVFRHHGLPSSIVSDRDPRFTSAFWNRLFDLLGTRLMMSTAAHPETDGQTERVNRVLEDVLRSYATSYASWSSFLPLAEFALNNAVHVSTGLTPFFVNPARHPRVPSLLAVGEATAASGPTLGGGGMNSSGRRKSTSQSPTAEETSARADVTKSKNNSIVEWAANALINPAAPAKRAVSFPAIHDPTTGAGSAVANFEKTPDVTAADAAAISDFLLRRQSVVRFVRDAIAQAVGKQKENADKRERKNTDVYSIGDKVLLSVAGSQSGAVTNLGAVPNLGANKLLPRFIGPFMVMAVKGDAYTIDIPTTMRLHPTFYVG